MNRRSSLLLALLIIVVAGAALAAGFLSGQAADGCKPRAGSRTYQVVIKGGTVSPATTTAHLCDQLVITNRDTTTRLIAFGPHAHHQPYDGVTERLLGQNQSLTLRLNQAGAFLFHDHLHDEVQGGFIVSG